MNRREVLLFLWCSLLFSLWAALGPSPYVVSTICSVSLILLLLRMKGGVGSALLVYASVFSTLLWHWHTSLSALSPSSLVFWLALRAMAFTLPFLFAGPRGGLVPQLRFACAFALSDAFLDQFGGGSFGSPAYAWAPYPSLVQVASITGHTGITFLVAWAGFWLSDLAFYKRKNFSLVCPVVVAMVALGGWLRIPGENGYVVQALVLDIPRSQPVFSRTPTDSFADMARYRMLAKRGVLGSPHWILLPETAFIVSIPQWKELKESLARWAKEDGSTLVAGVALQNPGWKYENRAVWFGPDGSMGYRTKQMGAPGEPLVFSGGEAPGLFDPPIARGKKAGVVICAESESSFLHRSLLPEDAGLQIVLARLSESIEPLHSYVTILRAVENGIPLVKASSGGNTLSVDSWGRLLSNLRSSGDERLVPLSVATSVSRTIFSRWGAWFPMVCLVGFLLLSLNLRKRL
jgi:apolipoprotein N-acyltransferase